jgi:hypothetical protein
VNYEVRWGEHLAHRLAEAFDSERGHGGTPSQYDFVCGPLAAAIDRCRDFDSLPEEAGPAVRSVWTQHPVFGPVLFIVVLVGDRQVELADFGFDEEYWDQIDDDPGPL